MKDLDKKPADANPPAEENSNKAMAEKVAPESDFGVDFTLTDEPVLEKDYFTFNIQDIIKAVNEHEAASAKDEAVLKPAVEPELTIEPATEVELQSQETNEQISDQNHQPVLEKDALGSGTATSEQDVNQNHQPNLEKDALGGQAEKSECGSEEPQLEPEQELVKEPGSEEPATEPAPQPEPEPEAEPASALEPAPQPEPEPEADPASAQEPTAKAKPRFYNQETKKLVIADIVLAVVIIASIVGGLFAANALVDKANAAKQEKIAAVQENIKEVDLTEELRTYAADEVLEQIKVPTYTLDELYALDLREKTGFTEEDLKIITTRGLKGCEKAFVEAEEKYGVNSIFLISIASLESAYGTQMFRPNNMFGYGRTGFSSKSECIMTVAKGLGTRYLQPGASLYGGSPTLKGVNKRYAANPQWYYKVGKYMQRYYNELAAAKNGNVEKFE